MNRFFALAALLSLPLVGSAFYWPIKPSAEVKADLVSYLAAEASTNAAVRGDFAALKAKVAAAKGLDWMSAAYGAGNAILKRCEGADLSDATRRAALELIDYPVHVNNYDTNDLAKADLAVYYRAVSDQLVAARRRVLAEARAAKVAEGTLRVWRVYNMVFLVKGPRHTALFDLTDCPRAPKAVEGPWTEPGNLALYTDADYADFAQVADVLFMTHPDADHYASGMLKAMTAAGKPIVTPCPSSWKNRANRPLVDDPAQAKFTVLEGDDFKGREIGGLLVRNFLGDQGTNIPCNVYHVTMDGFAIVNNGDNYVKEKERFLAKCPPADLILCSTWNVVRVMAGACTDAPGFDRAHAVLVPGHENEVSHRVNHRESYWEMYTHRDRFGDRGFPWPTVKPLHWGESLVVTKPQVTWWAVPPTSGEQRLPDADPTDGEKGGTVRIVLAKDEYEPGSFVVRSDVDLGKARFELSEFKQVEKVGGGGEREKGIVFPKEALDLKVVKVWYQNGNGWWSYFGDCGKKLCPELLLNDEDLIRIDPEHKANYARLTEKDGRVHEHWLNPPRQFDQRCAHDYRHPVSFLPMRENFCDAKTLQPVTLAKGVRKQFFLTVHATKETPAGLYVGEVRVVAGTASGRQQGVDQTIQQSNNRTILSIPVSIRVLDFTLPPPKCYTLPEKDFLVCSYNYSQVANIMSENGGDRKLAERQFEAVLADQVRHGQTMHWVPGGIGPETDFVLDTMQRVGMRTDIVVGGVRVPNTGKLDDAVYAASAKEQAEYYDKKLGHHNMFIGYGDEPGCGWLMKVRDQEHVWDIYQRAGFQFILAAQNGIFWKLGYDWGWHNASTDPGSDNDAPTLWNQVGQATCGWYAVHHTGPENPDFNRRQYGMAAYLGGYSAACNYAHHYGPYNDDADYYKPMVFAYGCGNGVIDTLQWEGFREGIDDIRYATEACRLARAAIASGDFDTRRLGRRTLMFFASTKRDKEELDALRADMIEYILKLRAALGAKAPPPLAQPKNDTFRFGPAREHPKGEHEKGGKFYGWTAEAAEESLPGLLAKSNYVAAAQTLMCVATHGLGPHYAFNANYEALYRDWQRIRAWTAGNTNFTVGANTAGRAYAAACVDRADVKGAQDVLASVLRDKKMKAGELYEFRLEQKLLACADDEKTVEATARAFDAAFDGELAPKARTEAIDRVGSFLSSAGRVASMRGLWNFRASRYAKPYPRKVCKVRYSDRTVAGLASFEKLAGLSDRQRLDRPFGGNTEMFVTDVATGDRGTVKAGEVAAADAPTLDVVCDDWGVHVRLAVTDEKAEEVANGIRGGGSIEAYVAPGENTAYTCVFAEMKPNSINFFNTAYDGPGHRRVETKNTALYKQDFAVEGKELIVYYAFSWDAFPSRLPANGTRWDFEQIVWGAKASPTWNGIQNIHGRSTWGILEFEMTDAQRARLLRKRLCKAAAQYKTETWSRGMREGLLDRWYDPVVGDPAFCHAELDALKARLDDATKRITPTMSDAEALELADRCLTDFEDLRWRLSHRRAEYLKRHRTSR